jgi:hypothetical protein
MAAVVGAVVVWMVIPVVVGVRVVVGGEEVRGKSGRLVSWCVVDEDVNMVEVTQGMTGKVKRRDVLGGLQPERARERERARRRRRKETAASSTEPETQTNKEGKPKETRVLTKATSLHPPTQTSPSHRRRLSSLPLSLSLSLSLQLNHRIPSRPSRTRTTTKPRLPVIPRPVTAASRHRARGQGVPHPKIGVHHEASRAHIVAQLLLISTYRRIVVVQIGHDVGGRGGSGG